MKVYDSQSFERRALDRSSKKGRSNIRAKGRNKVMSLRKSQGTKVNKREVGLEQEMRS